MLEGCGDTDIHSPPAAETNVQTFGKQFGLMGQIPLRHIYFNSGTAFGYFFPKEIVQKHGKAVYTKIILEDCFNF